MMTLEPHTGDFVVSGWVACEAPCCHELHSHREPGWFAIPKGTAHYYDKALNQHYHFDCGEVLIATGQAERVIRVKVSDPAEVLRRG